MLHNKINSSVPNMEHMIINLKGYNTNIKHQKRGREWQILQVCKK